MSSSRRPYSAGRPSRGCSFSAWRPLTMMCAVAAADSGDCASRKSVSRSRSSSARGAKTSRGTLELSLARSRGPASFEARFEVAQDFVPAIDQPVLRDFLASGQRVAEELAPPLGKGGLQLDGFDHERVWRLAHGFGGMGNARLQLFREFEGRRDGHIILGSRCHKGNTQAPLRQWSAKRSRTTISTTRTNLCRERRTKKNPPRGAGYLPQIFANAASSACDGPRSQVRQGRCRPAPALRVLARRGRCE